MLIEKAYSASAIRQEDKTEWKRKMGRTGWSLISSELRSWSGILDGDYAWCLQFFFLFTNTIFKGLKQHVFIQRMLNDFSGWQLWGTYCLHFLFVFSQPRNPVCFTSLTFPRCVKVTVNVQSYFFTRSMSVSYSWISGSLTEEIVSSLGKCSQMSESQVTFNQDFQVETDLKKPVHKAELLKRFPSQHKFCTN